MSSHAWIAALDSRAFDRISLLYKLKLQYALDSNEKTFKGTGVWSFIEMKKDDSDGQDEPSQKNAPKGSTSEEGKSKSSK